MRWRSAAWIHTAELPPHRFASHHPAAVPAPLPFARTHLRLPAPFPPPTAVMSGLSAKLQPVFEAIKARNSNEPEFLQAAEEILHSLGPVIEADGGDKYIPGTVGCTNFLSACICWLFVLSLLCPHGLSVSGMNECSPLGACASRHYRELTGHTLLSPSPAHALCFCHCLLPPSLRHASLLCSHSHQGSV